MRYFRRWYSIISRKMYRYLIRGSKRCKNVSIKERIALASFPVLCQTLFDWPRRQLLIQSDNTFYMSSGPHALESFATCPREHKVRQQIYSALTKIRLLMMDWSKMKMADTEILSNDFGAIFFFSGPISMHIFLPWLEKQDSGPDQHSRLTDYG